jgi:hypothetical protein
MARSIILKFSIILVALFLGICGNYFSVSVHNSHLSFNIYSVLGPLIVWDMKEQNKYTNYLNTFTARQLCLFSLVSPHCFL